MAHCEQNQQGVKLNVVFTNFQMKYTIRINTKMLAHIHFVSQLFCICVCVCFSGVVSGSQFDIIYFMRIGCHFSEATISMTVLSPSFSDFFSSSEDALEKTNQFVN